MTQGYTVAQTARLVSAMRWVLSRVADVTGGWARDADLEESEAAVWLAVLSRRLVSHCECFEALQPDSVRMVPYRDAVTPDTRLVTVLDQMAELPGTPARLATAQRVLIPCLVDACAEICAHAAPHCDAALARVAEVMGNDLKRHHLVAEGEVSSTFESTDKITQVLAQTGGLVPDRLLRPGI